MMGNNTTPASQATVRGRSDSVFTDVLRIRYWHHVLNEALKKRQFKVPIHLAFGHEAAAVAMNQVMGPTDRLCLSHRNVAYNLARSKSLDAVLRHYRLSAPSTAGAHMGSMNLATEGTGIAYSSSILGNNLAVAAGIAMHRSLVSKSGVVFALTGDGAMEEGVFWETLVFSKSHRLPMVIVIENNNCSMSSTIAQRRCSINISQLCAAVGSEYFGAAGAVLEEVEDVLRAARECAVEGSPACVELNLSTFCQHAGPTPGWPGDPLDIAIERGLMVEDTPNDPLYHIRNTLGTTGFLMLSEQVMKAGYGD
jgi:TPP-dependent pyruvate/acetoin dehydrogenase alpha subunit